MPGNLVPAQMYDHSCVIVKSVDKLYLTDYAAAPAAGQTYRSGAVISLDSSGKFVKGLPVGQQGVRPMPMLAIQGTDNFSANSDVNNISGGVNSGYVCSAGYEIETTEYVPGAYVPNDLLTGATAGDIGKLKKAAVSPDGLVPVCGVVSKGKNTNHDGVVVLRFWTVYLPAGSQASSSSSSSSSMSSSSRSGVSRSSSSESSSSLSSRSSRSSAFLSSSSSSQSSSH